MNPYETPAVVEIGYREPFYVKVCLAAMLMAFLPVAVGLHFAYPHRPALIVPALLAQFAWTVAPFAILVEL